MFNQYEIKLLQKTYVIGRYEFETNILSKKIKFDSNGFIYLLDARDLY